MKEKTFEELIEDYSFEIDERDVKYCYAGGVLELLQQVREATIAECLGIANKGYYWASTVNKIESIPTDRIQVD